MPTRFVIPAILIAMLPGRVSADYYFEYAVNGSFTQSITVNVGSTVDVQVYLAQNGSTTGLSSPGLSVAGVALTNYNVNIATVSAIAGGPAFDYSNTSGAGTGQANVSEGQLVNPPVTTSTNSILLGTFTFLGVAPGTTNIQTALPNPDPPYANNVIATSPTPTDIDGMIDAASGTITVVAVPEPGTIILCGLLAAGLAGECWRRWQIVNNRNNWNTRHLSS